MMSFNQFEEKFEKYIQFKHPNLSSNGRKGHYWLAFFMTFINHRNPSLTSHFVPGNEGDLYFLQEFVENTKKYNELCNSRTDLAEVEADLYSFYKANAVFTQTREFKEFMEVVSHESFEKNLTEAFPEAFPEAQQ